MIIYRANLAEKLFGYAISREFVKFDTVLCNLLDDPDLQLDFDLAINFNKAINGNLNARETFTNTFILCSGYIDPATINFYTRKMYNYPTFREEIARVNYIFANLESLPRVPNGVNTGEGVQNINNTPTSGANSFANTYINEASPANVEFYNRLKDAIKDCLNAPFNVFSDISSSTGKITQAVPAAISASILSIKPLKDSMISIVNGMDMTVVGKIPKAFQEGIFELSKACSNAWGNIQGAMIAEEDVPVFVEKASRGESLRTEPNNYIFTPDLKSYFDISTLSSDILGEVATNLGGNFSRYEYAVRYNGYDPEQNLSQANKDPIIGSVNGEPTAFNTVGQSGRIVPRNEEVLDFGTKPDIIATPIIQPPTNTNIIITPSRDLFVSQPVVMGTTFNAGGNARAVKATIFAGWIDKETKTVWIDSYAATADDVHTRKGVSNIGMVLTPSIPGSGDQYKIDQILNGNGTGVSGYTRNAEQNYDLTSFKLGAFNQGVATNEKAYSANGYSMTVAGYSRLGRQNKLFVAVSYENGPYELIQIIDRKGSLNRGNEIIDFTPYAFYKVTNARPIPRRTLTFVPGGWKQVTVGGVPKVGNMLVRYCVGDKNQILAALNS